MSLWKLNHLQILNPSPHLGLSFYELSTVEIQPPLFVLDLRKLVVDGDWTKFRKKYSPKWWFTMLESVKKHQKHLKQIQVNGWFMNPTTILQVRRTTWDGPKNHVNNGINYQPQLVIAGFLTVLLRKYIIQKVRFTIFSRENWGTLCWVPPTQGPRIAVWPAKTQYLHERNGFPTRATKKTLITFHYWLINRDPYIGLL